MLKVLSLSSSTWYNRVVVGRDTTLSWGVLTDCNNESSKMYTDKKKNVDRDDEHDREDEEDRDEANASSKHAYLPLTASELYNLLGCRSSS